MLKDAWGEGWGIEFECIGWVGFLFLLSLGFGWTLCVTSIDVEVTNRVGTQWQEAWWPWANLMRCTWGTVRWPSEQLSLGHRFYSRSPEWQRFSAGRPGMYALAFPRATKINLLHIRFPMLGATRDHEVSRTGRQFEMRV